MPIKHAIWKVTKSPAPLKEITLANEQQLEDMKIVLKDGVDYEKVLKRLQGFDFIEFAHFANKYKLHSNDPRYRDQWYIPKVTANLAWDITEGSGNLVVAVIDSGVDYSHNDINQNMWRNPVTGNYGFNIIANNENPMDLSGHGTHVAGVIGAITNNMRITGSKVKG